MVAGGLGKVRERRVLRMKRQRNEGREAVRFVLQFAQLEQMIDALFFGLDVAVKHGGVGAQANLVRGARDVEPLLPADFVVADNFAHARMKISAPPPGSESTPASLCARASAMESFAMREK